MRIQDIRKRRRAAHDHGKRQEAVQHRGDNPVQMHLGHMAVCVEPGQAKHGDGDDEDDAELGLVDVVVAPCERFGEVVGEKAASEVGDDGAEKGRGVHVAELLRGEVCGRAGEHLGEDDGDGDALAVVG